MFEHYNLSEFEKTKLEEIIESLQLAGQEDIVQSIALHLSLAKMDKGKLDFGRACHIILSTLKEIAKEQAKGYKIKDKGLSTYEEQYLLTRYCFVRSFEYLPQWLKDLY